MTGSHDKQLCVVGVSGMVQQVWRIQRVQEVLVAKQGRYVLVSFLLPSALPCWVGALGGGDAGGAGGTAGSASADECVFRVERGPVRALRPLQLSAACEARSGHTLS